MAKKKSLNQFGFATNFSGLTNSSFASGVTLPWITTSTSSAMTYVSMATWSGPMAPSAWIDPVAWKAPTPKKDKTIFERWLKRKK